MPLTPAAWLSASQKHQENKQRFLFKGFFTLEDVSQLVSFVKTFTCLLDVSYSLPATFLGSEGGVFKEHIN